MQLTKGHIFEGRYRIQGELGRGGFGMVYKAYQVGMDRHVALKVLNPEINAQAARTARERFLREVRIISKLRHPNTVTIHDFGETVDGMVYMVLEYVDGETLKDVLKRRGALDETRAMEIGKQIAKSLSEAHRHGIIHRDLKPANIMLTELGGEKNFVKVLDFGVARLRGGHTNDNPDLTSVGLPEGERELIGTPRYMSPEQVKGEELTGASDVYSLGLMLYEMLSGEPAVLGDTTMALITQQISPEALRLPNISRVHPNLQQIIRRSTQKSLQHRYRTVDILAQEIDQATMGMSRRQSGGFAQPGFASQSNELLLGNQYEPYQQPSGQWHNTQQPHGTGHFQTQQVGWSGAAATPSGQMMAPHMNNGPQPHYGADDYGRPPGFMTNPSGMQPVVNPNAPAPTPTHYGQSGQFPAQQGRFQGHAQPMQPSGFNPHPHHVQQQQQLNQNGLRQEWGNIELDAPTTPSMGALQRNAPPGEPAFSGLGDLPPPPDDNDNPFAVPTAPPDMGDERARAGKAPIPKGGGVGANPDDGLIPFTFALFGVILAVVGLGATLYLVFILLGAGLSQIVGGPIRFVVTVIAALVIPTVPLIAEGGKRERFKVVDSKLNRVRKALTVGVVTGMGSCLLLCFAFPDPIITSLRSDPNWFLNKNNPENESRAAQLNRKASLKTADIVEQSMVASGMYKAKPSKREMIESKTPLAPTRPKTKKDGTKDDTQGTKEEGTPRKPVKIGPPSTRREGRSALDRRSKSTKVDKPKDDKPSQKIDTKKDDTYEKW